MERTPKMLLEAITFLRRPGSRARIRRAHALANGVACPRQGCGSADVQAIGTRKIWRWQRGAGISYPFGSAPCFCRARSQMAPGLLAPHDTKNGTSSCELARALRVTQSEEGRATEARSAPRRRARGGFAKRLPQGGLARPDRCRPFCGVGHVRRVSSLWRTQAPCCISSSEPYVSGVLSGATLSEPPPSHATNRTRCATYIIVDD